MDRVRRVFPLFVRISEMREVGSEGITVKEDSMIGIDLSNSLIHTVVPLHNSAVGGVRWLIKRVVTSDPLVTLVMLGKLLPEPDHAILEVLVDPEGGDVGAVIAVPVGVLPATGSSASMLRI